MMYKRMYTPLISGVLTACLMITPVCAAEKKAAIDKFGLI